MSIQNNIIINGDCLEVMKNIPDKHINLVVVDLPYGQTACEWDTYIDLKLMWIQLKRILKDNGQVVFFCTTKFGNSIINSNPSWFRYDLIWSKTQGQGFLSANKMPLRKHEMMYIFHNDKDIDLDCNRNIENRAYAKKCKEFINKSMKKIDEVVGNIGCRHFYSCTSSQFALPTEVTYNKLIENFKLNEMKGFKCFNELDKPYKSERKWTYNPQKTLGKPYKSKKDRSLTTVYGERTTTSINNTGDRFPTSIQHFGYDKEKLHPTQKPVALCEWLIKSYSNEGDTVLDFCMGSGSTVIACINTNRLYIGIEKDKEIFNIANERILTHKMNIDEIEELLTNLYLKNDYKKIDKYETILKNKYKK
jgi:DNA modification methylase